MLRIRTIFSGVQGSPWVSTMFFGGTEDQTAANNANAAVGVFWNAVDTLMDTSVVWTTSSEVARIGLDGAQTGLFAVTPVASQGQSVADALPWATQAVIKWRTGSFLGGRELRGRTFVPGLTEATASEGSPSVGTVNTINAAAAALIADANSEFLVWSRRYAASSQASSGSTWTQWGVMRSRRD